MNMGSGSGTSLPFTCWARLTTTKQKTTICKNWLMHGLPFDYSVLSISCMYATCPSVTWISENDQTEPLRKLLLSFLSGSQLSNSFTPSQKFEFFFWLTHATRQSHRAAANCQIVRSFLNHDLFRKLKGWSFSDFFFPFFTVSLCILRFGQVEGCGVEWWLWCEEGRRTSVREESFEGEGIEK